MMSKLRALHSDELVLLLVTLFAATLWACWAGVCLGFLDEEILFRWFWRCSGSAAACFFEENGVLARSSALPLRVALLVATLAFLIQVRQDRTSSRTLGVATLMLLSAGAYLADGVGLSQSGPVARPAILGLLALPLALLLGLRRRGEFAMEAHFCRRIAVIGFALLLTLRSLAWSVGEAGPVGHLAGAAGHSVLLLASWALLLWSWHEFRIRLLESPHVLRRLRWLRTKLGTRSFANRCALAGGMVILLFGVAYATALWLMWSHYSSHGLPPTGYLAEHCRGAIVSCLFGETQLAERMQHRILFSATTLLTLTWLALRGQPRSRRSLRVITPLLPGLALMFLEDRYNLRHALAQPPCVRKVAASFSHHDLGA